ncbi:MAG: DUF6261 family protein [Petrimonas sp.]|nr:DUF6261 family protein [Petrimonas sp.]
MKRFTQSELIEFVNALVNSTKSALSDSLTDAIAKKYLQKMEIDANELESTRATILKSETSKQILEADRVRDRALSVFRRLMQVYELSEDNSPEAIAYEELNELWTKKYEALPYLNLAVETSGIEDLLFDLSTSKYTANIQALNLKDAVEKIRKANEEFKQIYDTSSDENQKRSNYDARALHLDLMETLQQYDDYVNALSRSSENNKEMVALQNVLQETKKNHLNYVSNRHGKLTIDRNEATEEIA